MPRKMFIYLIGKREKEKDINGKNRVFERERGSHVVEQYLCTEPLCFVIIILLLFGLYIFKAYSKLDLTIN